MADADSDRRNTPGLCGAYNACMDYPAKNTSQERREDMADSDLLQRASKHIWNSRAPGFKQEPHNHLS